MKCPCCNNTDRIYFKQNWSKKYHDFACGHCRLEMKIKLFNSINVQHILNTTFDFIHLEPVREKIDNMSIEQKLDRLKELDKKHKW